MEHPMDEHDDFEPHHNSSPTDHVLQELQLYGYRPFEDEPDPRPLPEGKRLDQLDRRLARTERDVGIGIETLAVFIRFWLATTPALPEPAAQAARAKAGERYDAFVTALGRRLAKGPRLRQEIPEDVSIDGKMSTASY